MIVLKSTVPLLAFLLVFTCSVIAADDESQELSLLTDPQAVMDLYIQAGTPGAHHKVLEKLAGSFDVKGQMWPGPGDGPVDSSGASKGTLIMDGRFLEQRFRGEFMGMPFHGVSITGYDNVKKKFVGSWIDSMGTGIMTSTGSMDEDGRVLSFVAEYSDPVMGPVQYDEKITIVDEDHHIVEMWGPAPDGNRFKMMELHYTRTE